MLERAFSYLRAREAALDPGSFVLVHGDPHGGNALRTLEGDGYKFIDPDGLWYEKAYDLGVLLREWREDYAPDPVQKGKERCAYLHQLTGVDKEAIFQWGFLQCVSTGLLYWDIHRETGQELLGQIREMGVRECYVTLHVGLGTFRPVKAEDISDHEMHAEFCQISRETAEAINETKRRGGRVICVGTTSCRTIESFAAEDGTLKESAGWTNIFIYPGYRFKVLDGLITNFHLPESTLIMLVSALAGREHVLAAYEEAVRERYRFFSFGDAMIIL